MHTQNNGTLIILLLSEIQRYEKCLSVVPSCMPKVLLINYDIACLNNSIGNRYTSATEGSDSVEFQSIRS